MNRTSFDKTGRRAWRRLRTALLVTAAILAGVFLAGRYGWKLLGFSACQSAGITRVEVDRQSVRLTGFYPGSFPEGCCGYYAREQDGRLYVGFRFSAVFGMFETGDFDVAIPVRGEIREVILKTRQNEALLWNAQNGFLPQSARYGVWVNIEDPGVCTVRMTCAGPDGGRSVCAAIESGEFQYLDSDIIQIAKDAEAPVPFTLTVMDGGGSVTASGRFLFDAGQENLYLTVTADGRILEA